MSVLSDLPASNSREFRLNKLDWMKLIRLLTVQIVAALLMFAPTLTGFHYMFHGTDYTVPVLVAVNFLVEAGRRFVAGNKAGP